MFLDADDVLAPDALEVLSYAWTPETAAIAYRLDLIDAVGQIVGTYPVAAAEGDLAPMLLARGHFRFMPTSGNLFTRAHIARAFPLPAARWRISADALLLRAAALAGPFRTLPLTLGAYRAHGGNAYYRATQPQTTFLRRSLRDMADGCRELADMQIVVPLADPDAARLDLLLAFLRLRMAGAEPPDVTSASILAVREVLPRVWRLRLGSRAHAVLALALGGLPVLAAISPQGRRWVAEPQSRPRIVGATVERLLGPGLAARRYALQAPRWAGSCHGPVFAPSDWLPEGHAGVQTLRRSTGTIRVPIDFMPRGGELRLEIVATSAYAAIPLEVSLSCEGTVLARVAILGGGEIATDLDPMETLAAGTLTLRITVQPLPAGPLAWLSALWGPCAMLSVVKVSLLPLPGVGSGILLAVGDNYAWDVAAGACQTSPPPEPSTGWPDRVESPRLELAILPTTTPADLVVRFGASQTAGCVTVCGSGRTTHAEIGPGSELRVPLLDPSPDPEVATPISFDFDPDDPFTTPAFRLAGLSLTSTPTTLLEPGAEHRFEGTSADGAFLDGTWQADGSGAHLTETHGRLSVTISPAAGPQPELHLAMVPTGGELTHASLRVAVAEAGVPLTVTDLRGRALIAVPLAAALSRGNRRLDLDVHVALAVPDREGIVLRRGAVTLLSLRLVSVVGRVEPPRETRAAPAPTLSAEILAAGAAARRLSGHTASPPIEIEELSSRHRAIVAAIEALAARAAPAILLTCQSLEALTELGACVAPFAEDKGQKAWPPMWGLDLPDAARGLALAILTTPPWRTTAGADIGGTCDAIAAFPGPVASYLAATSGFAPDDADPYQDHLLKLLDFARRCLAGLAARPRLVPVAGRLLRRLRPHPLLFSGAPMRPVAEAFARAGSASLVFAGRRLTLRRMAHPHAGALRLGVFLRNLDDSPETRICIGTLGVLPRAAVTVTVFAHGASPAPVALWPDAELVNLGGLSVDSAVTAIRAQALDVMLLGAFVPGFDELAAIVAHRLAPLQVASTAVAPMTTGLPSFDIMLCDRGSMPPEAAGDYTERLAWSPVPVQRFPPPPQDPRPDREQARALLRARLGLASDAVLLVSGALEAKIGDALLDAWTDILATTPNAVLLLYPFATNWRMRHARSEFMRRVAAACAARSVAAGRVRILNLTRAQVEELLTGADLYLDSFPYAGATTVVEALQAGLPAVALAGHTQRGLQGAAWLRAYGLEDLVATDPAGYVARATAIASDLAALRTAAEAIRAPAALDAETYGPRFAAFLRGLAGFPEAVPSMPRYVFHHMPKAAGTTCRDVLAGWFELRVDDREPWSEAPPPPRVSPDSIGTGELLCGHFNARGYSLRGRYPEMLRDPDWRLITFLRDPLDTAISYHFFERRHRPRWDPAFLAPDLDAYLEAAPRHLGEHLASVDDDWRTALERYWFVGTVDRLEECLNWLASALGRPAPSWLPWLNISPDRHRASPDAVRTFVRRNAEEFEIWRAAAARCDRLLASDPSRWRI